MNDDSLYKYVPKSILPIIIVTVFILIILFLPLVSAESCLLSTYQENDTHIGQCGYFDNEITFNGTINLVEGLCGSQNFILSLYKPNDTHISGTEGYFNYSLCSPDMSCEITTSCSNTALGSLYQVDDSHWGSPTYYDNILCCPIKERVEEVDKEKRVSCYRLVTMGFVNKCVIEKLIGSCPVGYYLSLESCQKALKIKEITERILLLLLIITCILLLILLFIRLKKKKKRNS